MAIDIEDLEDILNKLQTSLDSKNSNEFTGAIEALKFQYGGTPWDYGNDKIADLTVKHNREEVSLLEYVFRWRSPLLPEQTAICTILFNALGKYLLNGPIDEDPLVRACRENNLDILILLLPHYIRTQDDLVRDSQDSKAPGTPHKKIKLTEEQINSMSARVIAAIDATRSEDALGYIEAKEKDSHGAISPRFGRKTVQDGNGATHGSIIQEKINTQRIKIQNAQKQQEHPTCWKGGMALGFTLGCFAIGCLVGTAFLVEHCTKEYSARTFDASKMFKQLAEFIWESAFQQSHTPASKVLFISGAGFTAVTAGVGAVVGNRTPKLGG